MPTDITSELMPKLNQALENTTTQLLTKLLEIIEKDVYSYGATWTNGWDGDLGRTEQFKASWEKSKATIVGNMSESKIFQNYLTMVYEPPFSHGSPKRGQLAEDALSGIINEGLGDTGIGFPAIKGRPFWTEFKNYVNENFDRILETNCMILGIPVSGVMGSVIFD